MRDSDDFLGGVTSSRRRPGTAGDSADLEGVTSSRRNPGDWEALREWTGLPPEGRPAAIAEAGTAHRGDIGRGLELIDAAAESGADVVKFQVVFADEILPPQAGTVPLPGGEVPLYDVFRSLERPGEFYARLAEHAESRGIGFLATPFGERGVRLLEEVGVRAWKIASPELNHEPLVGRLAGTGRPMIISTGVSRAEDIQRALKVADTAWPGNRARVILLHCLTSYPAPEAESNLRAIPAMAAAYERPAGLSDHSLHPVLLPALAAALGAAAVEKHITLDRSGGGLDDKVALIPDDFARMTSAMRRIAGMSFGDAVNELNAEFTPERVEAALGPGRIGLAPSEEDSYERSRRSLHAVGSLDAGTLIGPHNTALLRTEKVLTPGLPPHRRHAAYGRRLRRNIPAGDGITWTDLAE